MSFGEFLRSRRQQLGISLSELSSRLALRGVSISKAGIQHWEGGRNDPPLEDELFRTALAMSLEMSVNELMSAIGYIKSVSDYDSNAMRAADIVSHMTPDKQAIAIDILERLARD